METIRGDEKRRGDRINSVSISSEALVRVCRESVTCGKSSTGGGGTITRASTSRIRVSRYLVPLALNK